MTYLSRLAKLGLAKETTAGTYVAPTDSIPFTKASFEDIVAPLRDESVRANDAVLQGLYAGTTNSTWDIDTNLYPDVVGHFLRAMIGPDTVGAGVSTVLASGSSPGTSISTSASIGANAIIQVDTGTNLEYAKVASVSGSGPYTLTLTAPGLTLSHSNGVAVVSQTSHTFAQNRTSSTVWPTYSITVDDLTDVRGHTSCVCSEVALKVDPKGIVTISPKYVGFASTTQSTFTPSYTTAQPLLGWQWTMTNAGGASTRGLTLDLTLKRAVDPIWSSDGVQQPREVFPGAMEMDGSYKAIYENNTDLNLYLNYTQSPTVATLTQPVSVGGASLAVTMTKSGYHKGAVALDQVYVQASFDISAIYNSTDSGITSVVLKNFRSTAY